MVAVLIAMLIYGLLHSLLASQTAKGLFRRRFGERAFHGLYRLYFNALAGILFIPIAGMIVFYDNRAVWRVDDDLQWLLMALQLVGIIGFTLSLLQINLSRFAGIEQARAFFKGDDLPLPPESLTTGGVYRLVRHPLYLFSLLIIWPVTTMTHAYLGFAIGATLYFIVGSLYEERRLLEAFGDDYRDYRAKVAWIIPFLHLGNKS